ncbi:MAG: hypothetical protein ABL999_12095 [Pyrinomonadaceae bacterium]
MLNKLAPKCSNFFSVLILAAILSIGVNAISAQPGSADDRKNYDLTGTWSLRITPDDGGPSFIGFYSFGGDGNASFSSAGPPIPGLGNPGYGVWKKNSRSTFVSLIKMISYTSDFQFDGSVKIKAEIRMTGPDSFVTSDAVTIYDPEGNEIVVLGGNAVGTRIKVTD